MSKADLYQRLDKVNEIRLSVKGRKSGREISRPVWFVHEGNTLFLLPVDPKLKIKKSYLKLDVAVEVAP